MIVNLSIELMFYIKDKIEKMVRSAGLEPTPQASEFQKAHQIVTIIYNLLAYFVQRVQVSSVIKVGIPFS